MADAKKSLYVVDRIVDDTISKKGRRLYRVRWKGYGPQDDTWEPVSNLSGCLSVVSDFKMKKDDKVADHFPSKRSEQDMKPKIGDNKMPKAVRRKSPSSHNAAMKSESPSFEAVSKRKALHVDLAGQMSSKHTVVKKEMSPEFIKYDMKPIDLEAYKDDLHYDLIDLEKCDPPHFHKMMQRAWSRLPAEQKLKRFRDQLYHMPGPEVHIANEVDDEPCPELSFRFISSYRFGPGVINSNPNFNSGCLCASQHAQSASEQELICDLRAPEKCQCLDDMIEPAYAYRESGQVRFEPGQIIYECNDRCSCSILCPNRVVQRGTKLPLHLFKTAKKGWGVRCPRFIEQGTFVTAYVGEVVNPDEASKRDQKFLHEGSTYLFDMDLLDEGGYTIDARYFGNVSRFFNHSCDPNLAIYSVVQDRSQTRVYTLALFAIKNIDPFEELCFDYGGWESSTGGHARGGKLTKILGTPTKKMRHGCNCGTKGCRGWLFQIAV